jgi:hypothetical protein
MEFFHKFFGYELRSVWLLSILGQKWEKDIIAENIHLIQGLPTELYKQEVLGHIW